MTTSSERRARQAIVISGLSGSGKSVALRALEDAGWVCIDNLPATTLQTVVEALSRDGFTRIALGIDARNRSSLDVLPAALSQLRDTGLDVRQVFLDASDHELLRRFAETRRPHPFSADGLGLEQSIHAERQLLQPFAQQARRIDTTHLRANALRAEIKAFASADPARLTLFLCSFGFKYGIPQEADFVFDVRFLPNPYYDPGLRPLDGRDAAVAEFLAEQPMTAKILDDVTQLVSNWLPAFVQDHRSLLTIAIGCTGGQHRSVYLVERLAERLSASHATRVIHRSLHP
jgi:UPF0042 nucleotide-binding protein